MFIDAALFDPAAQYPLPLSADEVFSYSHDCVALDYRLGKY